MFQTLSIRVRSGDLAGQERRLHPCKQCIESRAVRGKALLF